MAPTVTTIPEKQTAVIAGPDREFMVTHDHPVTDIIPESIIIKVIAVALNPVDTKLSGDFVVPGVTFGFDAAGIVLKIGSNVKKNLKIGDRVCGAAGGMDWERPAGGAFVEYAGLIGDMCFVIPDSVSFEDASTFGTAINTAALAIFFSNKISPELLRTPAEKGFPVLVYGGSTAVGTTTIQLLKFCGLRPLVTCSPKNFDLVKSFGAEKAWDYRSPTCAADIKAYTKNGLRHVIDCVTIDSSLLICYAAIGRGGGHYCALDPYSEHLCTRKVVTHDWICAFRMTGRACPWPAPFSSPPDPDMLIWGIPMYDRLQELLDEGKLRAHPVQITKGGFENIIIGVDMLRKKQVSGAKLVYRVADV